MILSQERNNVKTLLDAYDAQGFKFFSGGKKNFNLNIGAIRSSNRTSGRFDDIMFVMWKHRDKHTLYFAPCTTDPGKEYLVKPMTDGRTLIMKEGQYRGAFKLCGQYPDGRTLGCPGHGSKRYTAYRQVKSINYYADRNRDDILDTTIDTPILNGNFSTNLHRASLWKKLEWIGKYSAGCQVVQDPKHFEFLINLGFLQLENYDNSFTYTLFTEEQIKQKLIF